jgi:outer membrane protease
MPDILLQTLYIDFYTQGPDVALRQIIEVVKGDNNYTKDIQEFQNVRAYITAIENGYKIEFRAEVYMEPQSHFAVGLENDENEINYSSEGINYLVRL